MPYERPNFGGIARPDFPVPDDEAPEGTRCIKIHVPDDPQHVQIMLGSLLLLTNFFNYQRGQQEKAEAVAELWENIIEATDFGGDETCDMYRVRVDPENPCILQETLDGLEWVNIVDASYVPLDGSCAMTGGLEIYPEDHVESLIVRRSDSAVSHDIIKVQRETDNLSLIRVFRDGEIGCDTTVGGNDKYSIYGGNFSVKYGSAFRAAILGITDAAYTFGSKAAGRPLQLLAVDANTSTVYVVGKNGSAKNMVWRKFDGLNYDHAWIGADGDGHFGVRDSSSGVVDAVTLNHEHTGTPSNGLGVALSMTGKSTTNTRDMARIAAQWSVATDSVRQSALLGVLYGWDSPRQAFVADYGVLEPEIGFLGGRISPRVTIDGDCQGNSVLKSVIAALHDFGFVEDETVLGDAPAPIDIPSALNLRCNATAAIRYIVEKVYYRCANEMTFTSVGYLSATRWDNCKDEFFPFGLADGDTIYTAWADPIYNAGGGDPETWLPDHMENDILPLVDTYASILYTYLDGNGRIDLLGWLAFKDAIYADNYDGATPDDGATWFYAFIDAFDYTDMGVMIASAIQTDYVEFTNCGWCKSYAFNGATYVGVDEPFNLFSGTWSDGSGWISDETGEIFLSFPYAMDSMTFDYSTPPGATSMNVRVIDLATLNEYTFSTHTGGVETESWIADPEGSPGEGTEGFAVRFNVTPSTEFPLLAHISVQGSQGSEIPPSGTWC